MGKLAERMGVEPAPEGYEGSEEDMLAREARAKKALESNHMTDSSGNVIRVKSREEAARASEEIREGQDKE